MSTSTTGARPTASMAYPLHWPAGRERTPEGKRQAGVFKTTVAKSRDEVYKEIKMLRGTYPLVSSDVPVRKDGLMIGTDASPDDPGVAVYFELKGKQMCIACDRYKLLSHNLKAVAKTIEAMRGIERWGTGDMLERSFLGFQMLPEALATPWREVLGLQSVPVVTEEAINAMYRAKAFAHHPDRGGDPENFATLTKARDMGLTEIRSKG